MTEKRRRRWPRRLAIAFGAFVGLLVLLWALRFPLFGGLLKDTIGGALAAEGIRLEVDDISGSLLADAELSGIRVLDSTGLPMIREASVGRVSVTFSLLGLVAGRDDWIRSVEIEGFRGVLDLAAPPGPEREPEPPSEEGGTTPLPGRVRITGFDLEVRNGEDLLQIVGGELQAARGDGTSYRGSFGAELARSVVESIERRAEEVRAEFSWDGATAVVDAFRMNGTEQGRVLLADLSRLAEERIAVDLDLPLFGGRLRVEADLDLAGDHPRGQVDVAIARMDPRPVLRFIPDVPVDLDALEGTIQGRLSGTGPPGLDTIEGSYDLTLSGPAYEGRRAESLLLTGTLEDGAFVASGRIAGPEITFEGTAAVTGEVVRIDGTVDIPALDLALLALSLDGHEVGGTATLKGHAEGPVDALRFGAELSVASPRIGDRTGDRLSFRASGTPAEIRLESLVLERGEDRLAVREGLVRPEREPLEFSGALEVDLATLDPYRAWIPADLPPGLDGRIHVEARAAGTPDAPDASALIRIKDLRMDDLSAALVEIRATLPTPDRVLLSSLVVDGEGDLPHLEISDAVIDLGEAALGISVGGLKATRDGQELSSRGPLRAEISEEGVRLTAPLLAAGVGLDVDAGLTGRDDLSGSVHIRGGDLATLSRVLALPVPLAGTVTGEIRLGGTTARPDLELDLDLPALTASPSGRPDLRLGPVRVRFRYRDDVARLEELTVRGEGGWTIGIGATVPIGLDDFDAIAGAPILDGRIEITDLPLSAGGPLPGVARADGRLNLDLAIGGTVQDPALTGSLDLRAADLRVDAPGVPPVTDFEFVARLQALSPSGGRVEIESLKAVIAGAQLNARAGVGHRRGAVIDPTLEANLTGVQLARVFEILGEPAPVTGRFDLTLRVQPGPLVALEIQARELAQPGFAPATLGLSGNWADGWFQIETARLASSAGRIDLAGRIPIDLDLERLEVGIRGPARPELTVTPDLDLAALRLGGNGMRASGRIRGRIESRGTFDAPDAEGEIRLEHVFLRSPGAPAVDDLSGAILIRPERIGLDELRGRLGRGDFRIHGSVAREALDLGELDILVQGRDLLVVRDRAMTLRTDLDCRLTGRAPRRLRLAGEVEIRSLRYSANVDYLTTEPSLAPLPLTDDPALSGFELDLVVLIPPGTTKIRTNVLDGELEGRLEVGGTLAVPRPDGRVRILDGVAKLPTTSLKMEQGFVEFRRSQPLRPYLDAGLATSIAGTDLNVQVSGPASNLRIELSSNPPLPEPDILSILVTGVPRSELGAGTVGSVAATILYRQLTASLGGDDTGEPSGLAGVARSIEIEVDTSSTSSGGTPNWSATLPLIGDWFLLRGGQDDPQNYGLDLIWRLSFK